MENQYFHHQYFSLSQTFCFVKIFFLKLSSNNHPSIHWYMELLRITLQRVKTIQNFSCFSFDFVCFCFWLSSPRNHAQCIWVFHCTLIHFPFCFSCKSIYVYRLFWLNSHKAYKKHWCSFFMPLSTLFPISNCFQYSINAFKHFSKQKINYWYMDHWWHVGLNCWWLLIAFDIC